MIFTHKKEQNVKQVTFTHKKVQMTFTHKKAQNVKQVTSTHKKAQNVK